MDGCRLAECGVRPRCLLLVQKYPKPPPGPPGPPTLHIGLPTGHSMEVEFSGEQTLSWLKGKVSEACRAPPEEQLLFFNGEQLEGDASFSACGLQVWCFVQVVLRGETATRFWPAIDAHLADAQRLRRQASDAALGDAPSGGKRPES